MTSAEQARITAWRRSESAAEDTPQCPFPVSCIPIRAELPRPGESSTEDALDLRTVGSTADSEELTRVSTVASLVNSPRSEKVVLSHSL